MMALKIIDIEVLGYMHNTIHNMRFLKLVFRMYHRQTNKYIKSKLLLTTVVETIYRPFSKPFPGHWVSTSVVMASQIVSDGEYNVLVISWLTLNFNSCSKCYTY